MSLGHETLVRVGAALVGIAVLAPMIVLWGSWLVRKGRGGAAGSRR